MKETLGIFAFSCLSLLTASAFAAAPAWLDTAVSAEAAHTVDMRRHLHANPELGNQEKQTQAYIVQKLKEFGVDEVLVGYKNSPTAVIGVINPKKADAICWRSEERRGGKQWRSRWGPYH